jgi:hypothetical protein
MVNGRNQNFAPRCRLDCGNVVFHTALEVKVEEFGSCRRKRIEQPKQLGGEGGQRGLGCVHVGSDCSVRTFRGAESRVSR